MSLFKSNLIEGAYIDRCMIRRTQDTHTWVWWWLRRIWIRTSET